MPHLYDLKYPHHGRNHPAYNSFRKDRNLFRTDHMIALNRNFDDGSLRDYKPYTPPFGSAPVVTETPPPAATALQQKVEQSGFHISQKQAFFAGAILGVVGGLLLLTKKAAPKDGLVVSY